LLRPDGSQVDAATADEAIIDKETVRRVPLGLFEEAAVVFWLLIRPACAR